MTNVLWVCTGNAARSVMAVTMTRARAPHLEVRGAGTFSLPGLPMSQRTRNALADLGLSDPQLRQRRLGRSSSQKLRALVLDRLPMANEQKGELGVFVDHDLKISNYEELNTGVGPVTFAVDGQGRTRWGD